jgi:hypothetical protein
MKDLDRERPHDLDESEDEPPVVARLMIEIRSDGSRTIARGAIEDAERGERVALHAEGRTPAELAFSLVKMLFKMPSLARTAAKALLPGRRK